MKSKQPEQKKPSELRKRAEENLRTQITPPGAMSDKEASRLIHELQVHQSELEMQNEELRKAQSEIEESRTRYSDLYDFAPVGYFTFDKHGLILEANLAAATELGIERSRLINKPFRAYIVTEDRNIFDQHFQENFKSDDRQTCEIRLKRKDGSEFYAQLESIAAEDLKGNSLCRTSVSNITLRKHAAEALRKTYDELELRVKERTKDLAEANEQLLREIEERKKAAESLRESEERYRTITNSLPNVVFVYKGSTIHYINESGLKILGYLRDEVIGKNVFDFLADDSKELVAKNMQRRISGEHVENYEVKVITKSKDIKYFLLNAAIVPYEKEKAFVVVLFDITERKQAEDKIGQKMSEMESLNKRFYI
ncbi:MAG: PAS domain S-box protein [Thermodesulfovibrionales bacterium]